MEINWVEAWQISGIGFGLVFVILAILAVVTWLLNVLLNKNSCDNDETKARKEDQACMERQLKIQILIVED